MEDAGRANALTSNGDGSQAAKRQRLDPDGVQAEQPTPSKPGAAPCLRPQTPDETGYIADRDSPSGQRFAGLSDSSMLAAPTYASEQSPTRQALLTVTAGSHKGSCEADSELTLSKPASDSLLVCSDHMLPVGRGMAVTAEEAPREALPSLVAVFDGYGGGLGQPPAAELAADRIVRVLAKVPAVFGDAAGCAGAGAAQVEQDEVAAALRRAFGAGDEEIRTEAAAAGGAPSGADAVVALRVGKALYVAASGGGGAVLVRDGGAYWLTMEPDAVSQAVKRQAGANGAAPDLGAALRAERAHSTASVGRVLVEPNLQDVNGAAISAPMVVRENLQAADAFVIVGSPAVWACLHAPEAVNVLTQALKERPLGPTDDTNEAKAALQKAAADVIAACAALQQPGDLTVGIMAFRWLAD